MVGPVYGNEISLSSAQLVYFLATFVLGGAIGNIRSVGWQINMIGDGFLIWLYITSIFSSIFKASFSNSNITLVLIMSALFGVTNFPIYLVAARYAYDFASSD